MIKTGKSLRFSWSCGSIFNVRICVFGRKHVSIQYMLGDDDEDIEDKEVPASEQAYGHDVPTVAM